MMAHVSIKYPVCMRLEFAFGIKSFEYLLLLSASWRIVLQEGKRRGLLHGVSRNFLNSLILLYCMIQMDTHLGTMFFILAPGQNMRLLACHSIQINMWSNHSFMNEHISDYSNLWIKASKILFKFTHYQTSIRSQ